MRGVWKRYMSPAERQRDYYKIDFEKMENWNHHIRILEKGTLETYCQHIRFEINLELLFQETRVKENCYC